MAQTTTKKERLLAHKSPLVRAVAEASLSVVSIQGEKQYESVNLKQGTANSRSESRTSVPVKENTTHIGMGSGVIIDERGYILTNNHVVKDLLKIQIITNDETVYRDVEFIRNDVSTDLALLKINPLNPLKKIKFGKSSEVLPGEDVYAIGNPYGLQGSITRGIISGLNRPLKSSETISYDSVIQTDAAINPGNSGGPLINMDGEMIGLNAAVREDAQNIAFVIPVDIVKDVVNRMLSQSVAKMTHYGMEFKTVDIDSEEYPFSENKGDCLIVDSVTPRSPASSAGIEKGDVILTSNQYEIHSPLDFTCSLIGISLMDSVDIKLYRQGNEIESNLAFSNLATKRDEILALKDRHSNLSDPISLPKSSSLNLQSANTNPSYGAAPDRNQNASLVSDISNHLSANDSIKKAQEVRRFFGIEIQDISLNEYQKRFPSLTVISIGEINIIPSGGVLVNSVIQDCQFLSSEIQKGDVIFGFVVGDLEENQLGITTLDHLYYIAQKWDEYAALSPDQKAKFYLIRDNKPYFLEINMVK
ncbi:MAG: trypsin-like peptidase domain-containing protein [Planctomycetia bacterium]|nr:trypsin-like peptidase domain-containing protein [Planctomycetia bacterium]